MSRRRQIQWVACPRLQLLVFQIFVVDNVFAGFVPAQPAQK
jgi:hypothetical protein